jgi:hypothetical protein
MGYEFDDERNRSTPAVRPKGRSAKPPSGLLAMSVYAPSVYRMPMAAPTDCSRRVAYLRRRRDLVKNQGLGRDTLQQPNYGRGVPPSSTGCEDCPAIEFIGNRTHAGDPCGLHIYNDGS